MNILLDADEIDKAYFGGAEEAYITPRLNRVAKAQAEKIVDIIRSDCPETLFLLEDLAFWHELLEEIDDNKD